MPDLCSCFISLGKATQRPYDPEAPADAAADDPRSPLVAHGEDRQRDYTGISQSGAAVDDDRDDRMLVPTPDGYLPHLDVWCFMCIVVLVLNQGNLHYSEHNLLFGQTWVLQYAFVISGVVLCRLKCGLGECLCHLVAYTCVGVACNWAAWAIKGMDWRHDMCGIVSQFWFVVALSVYALLLVPLRRHLQWCAERSEVAEGRSASRCRQAQGAPTLWAVARGAAVVSAGLAALWVVLSYGLPRLLTPVLADREGAGGETTKSVCAALELTASNIWLTIAVPMLFPDHQSITGWFVLLNMNMRRLSLWYSGSGSEAMNGFDFMLLGSVCYVLGLKYRRPLGSWMVRYWFIWLSVCGLIWMSATVGRLDPLTSDAFYLRWRMWIINFIFLAVWLCAGELLIDPKMFTEDKCSFLNGLGLFLFLTHKAVHLLLPCPWNWLFILAAGLVFFALPRDDSLWRLVVFVRRVMPIILAYKGAWDRGASKEELGAMHRHYAPQIRQVVEEMQGFYLKLTQTIVATSTATRGLPKEFADELRCFMDQCPHLPFAAVQHIVESDLGPLDRIFDSFDEVPTNAASIGQVHRATLRGSSYEVVVKVQSPAAERLFHIDLGLFLRAAWWFAPKESRQFTVALLEEFRKQFSVEFDYRNEAAKQREAFGHVRGFPGVEVAEPVDGQHPFAPGPGGLCTKSVLVMDRLHGKSLASWGREQLAALTGEQNKPTAEILAKMKDMTPEEQWRLKRRAAALFAYERARYLLHALPRAPQRLRGAAACPRRGGPCSAEGIRGRGAAPQPTPVNPKLLADTLLKVQGHLIFRCGFVNGDPHPGNLMVLDDGTLGLIDWGASQFLPVHTRCGLARLVIAVAGRDEPLMAQCMRDLGGSTTRDLDWTHSKMAQYNLGSWTDDFVDEAGEGGIGKFQDNVNKVDPLLGCMHGTLMTMKNQITIRAVVAALGMPGVSSAEYLRPFAEECLRTYGVVMPEPVPRKAAVPPEVVPAVRAGGLRGEKTEPADSAPA